MANCPSCNHDVRTPFFLNLDAWTHLVCPHCKVRLELKPPRYFALAPLIAPLFVLARQGRVFEIIAITCMSATVVLLVLESASPRVGLRRKRLPKPTIRLNIDAPSS